MNSYDLSGRTAVVTGGSQGIGRAISERLVKSGAAVWIWDKAPAHTEGVRFRTVDVRIPDQIAHAVAAVLKEDARIDILINDAGYLGKLHAFDDHEPADWHEIMAVNLSGMMEVTRLVLPHMRRAGGAVS